MKSLMEIIYPQGSESRNSKVWLGRRETVHCLSLNIYIFPSFPIKIKVFIGYGNKDVSNMVVMQWKDSMLGSLAVSRDSALQSDDNVRSVWHQHAESCSNGDAAVPWVGVRSRRPLRDHRSRAAA